MKYNAVTVTQLNKYLKDRFDEDENLGAILVKGEISNFKNHYTGHLYFTLKDENSLIKCIMFKSYAERLAFKPKDGMKVMVFGSVSVFERDGVYQIYAKTSPPTFSFLAALSVIIPLDVEIIAIPNPFKTLGKSSTFAYILRPGLLILFKPCKTFTLF